MIFIESAKEKIVDINGIFMVPIFDISVPITLLSGEK